MAEVSHKEACPRCREQGRDKSGDNLVVYKDGGGAFCFSCDYTIKSGASSSSKNNKENKLSETKEVINKITEEQRIAVREVTEFVEYRGIREDTAKTFGVRYEVDDEGNVLKQYYPVTKDGELVGYKIRKHPKEFVALGYCGKEADLGGQFKFTSGGRDIIICAGEIDQLSAYQMLRDDMIERGKGHYEPPAVVTTLVGESAAHRQCQLNYNELNKFNRILICMDNDEAGKAATEKLIKVLPKGKIFIIEMDLKDPNEYLMKGRERDFVRAFWKARQYVPAGIISSLSLYDRMVAAAARPKVTLPPFLSQVQKMMAGGIPLKYIVTFAAGTGAAKTTIANECIYHWLFHSPYKPGIVTCELDAEQYGEALYSRHIQKKLALIEDPQEKVDFLNTEAAVKAGIELFQKEDGSERFTLMEDRTGTIESVKQILEEMIISCGCSLLVIDPIQDVIGDLSNEDQGKFMAWLKVLIKAHDVIVILISHVRKVNGAKDGLVMPSEDDIHGSSTIIKSSAATIMAARDKEADDPIERNTTYLKVPKLRWTGITGPAGKLYYDNNTHTLHDYDEFFGVKTTEF